MSAYPYLNPWLQCLLQLAPPRGLVHLGAGGDAQQYPFANMPRLLAIEANAQQHARIQGQLHNHACCQVLQAVVAGQPGTADFYTLSQSLESGLCAPAALQPLWPNIKALRVESLPTTTLQTLLMQTPDGAAAYNWVVMDCLPAGELLKGAGELIHLWDVLVLRVLKDTPAATNTAPQGLGLPALRKQLAAFGMEFVALEEENHPQMVRALFVRNFAQQLANDKAALTTARDEQAKLATERQTALAAMQIQHDSLAQERLKLIASSADLAKARDQLASQKEAETKAKAEAIAQRDALAKDKAALAVARDEQAKLATERQTVLASQQQATANLQQRLQQLEADNQEYGARQSMLQEELIKAEAQIDLIKDLLLREPGL